MVRAKPDREDKTKDFFISLLKQNTWSKHLILFTIKILFNLDTYFITFLLVLTS